MNIPENRDALIARAISADDGAISGGAPDIDIPLTPAAQAVLEAAVTWAETWTDYGVNVMPPKERMLYDAIRRYRDTVA